MSGTAWPDKSVHEQVLDLLRLIPAADLVEAVERDSRFNYRKNAIFRNLHEDDVTTPTHLRVLRLFLEAYGKRVVAVKIYPEGRACAVSLALSSPEYLEKYVALRQAAFAQ